MHRSGESLSVYSAKALSLVMGSYVIVSDVDLPDVRIVSNKIELLYS